MVIAFGDNDIDIYSSGGAVLYGGSYDSRIRDVVLVDESTLAVVGYGSTTLFTIEF